MKRPRLVWREASNGMPHEIHPSGLGFDDLLPWRSHLGEFLWHRRYHDDVFYFDTRCPNKGLKETSPMNFPRCKPIAAALDGKIYVFGGGSGNADSGEVFDPNLGLWAPLPEPPYGFCRPLLSDPSNTRLQAHPDGLYAYYPASNSWKSLNVDLSRCWGEPSVFVDDVIYFCFNPDGDPTNCLVAYDLVSNEYLDTVWSSDADCAFPTVPDIEWDVLLHLGNGKLCMAMSGPLIHTTPEATFAVQCITLKVHKEPAGNRVLVTEPSFHLIKFLACGAAPDFLLLSWISLSWEKNCTTYMLKREVLDELWDSWGVWDRSTSLFALRFFGV
ncbi:Kelch_1 domain-containing protein [Cephalotus follicularis]|uniref:Kelch_1 domain-containing protein n=1 Tax=Cephalotus follicularis TaxID=3775 RepID=A0A1Q3CW00_CEPFO|nr:Kelch_1 domain-containing protein [Cephalotus follicularis]